MQLSSTMNSPLPPPPLSFDHDDIIGGSTGRRRRRNKNRNTNNPLHSIQSTIDNICTQLSNKLSQCNTQLRNNQLLPPPHILLPSVISGTLAFYATSFSSQYIQYKLLKLSTGTRPMIIPISVGVATVAMGSWMGHLAGLGTVAAAKCTDRTSSSSRMQWNRRATPDFLEQCNSLLEEKILPMKDAACRTVHEMTRPMTIATNTNNNNNRRMQQERKEAWFHAARICIIGILTYKTLFRSNFMSLSPSSYTARGSFARKGIPIPKSSSRSSSMIPSSFNYATKSQREKLHQIGSRFGCHTCGSRLLFRSRRLLPNTTKKMIFHGDHIPPVSVAKQINNRWYNRKLGRTVAQRFYPQCTDCSNKQGGLLSRAVNAGHRNLHAAGGGSESHFHGWRMRVGHLTGGLVAVVSTVGVGNDDARWLGSSEEEEAEVLVHSSRDRIRSIQYWLEDLLYDAKRTMSNVWNGR
mmetsp:Transcript_6428/g.13560  ORF Transcript_6428/g.13560 Transcript_6428/m.13560 type:complete len:465 (+) Transcript_6428:87-1481(+)